MSTINFPGLNKAAVATATATSTSRNMSFCKPIATSTNATGSFCRTARKLNFENGIGTADVPATFRQSQFVSDMQPQEYYRDTVADPNTDSSCARPLTPVQKIPPSPPQITATPIKRNPNGNATAPSSSVIFADSADTADDFSPPYKRVRNLRLLDSPATPKTILQKSAALPVLLQQMQQPARLQSRLPTATVSSQMLDRSFNKNPFTHDSIHYQESRKRSRSKRSLLICSPIGHNNVVASHNDRNNNTNTNTNTTSSSNSNPQTRRNSCAEPDATVPHVSHHSTKSNQNRAIIHKKTAGANVNVQPQSTVVCLTPPVSVDMDFEDDKTSPMPVSSTASTATLASFNCDSDNDEDLNAAAIATTFDDIEYDDDDDDVSYCDNDDVYYKDYDDVSSDDNEDGFGDDDEDDDDEDDDDDEYSSKRIALEQNNISRYHKEFVELELIGIGQFGSVHKCLNRLDGITYAIKKSLNPIAGSYFEKTALNEVYAHAVLGKHQNVVRYYSAWAEDNRMVIQNEYCNGGSLADHIAERKRNNRPPMSETELKQLLWHLSEGLRYIHSLHLAHMDLKPANIFISSESRCLHNCGNYDSLSSDDDDEDAVVMEGNVDDKDKQQQVCEEEMVGVEEPEVFYEELEMGGGGGGGGGEERDDGFDESDESAISSSGSGSNTSSNEIIYKIGDLGHVTSVTPLRRQPQQPHQQHNVSIEEGDCRYLALEILNEDYTHLQKADIFALGLTVYEAGGCGGESHLPVNGPRWHEIREHAQLRPLEQCSNDFNELLRVMIARDPEQRPTATQLRHHRVLAPHGLKSKAQLRRELHAEKRKNEILSNQLMEANRIIKTVSPVLHGSIGVAAAAVAATVAANKTKSSSSTAAAAAAAAAVQGTATNTFSTFQAIRNNWHKSLTRLIGKSGNRSTSTTIF